MPEPKREERKIHPLENDADLQNPRSGHDGAPDGDPGVAGELGPAAEIAKLKTEKDDLLQTLVRRQADFENFRKRTERDRQEEGRRGVERLVMDMIPVLDGFDRALQAHEDPAYEEYRKGVLLIRKQLWDVLSRHGVQRVEASGKIFDPHMHQAIERVETTDYEDGAVVAVFQDGYLFHGRVLRPAIVRVAVHPAESSGEAN